MTCRMRLTNETVLAQQRHPPYRILASLQPTESSERCRFFRKRVYVIIDGTRHSMEPYLGPGIMWAYHHYAETGWQMRFMATYRYWRRFWWFFWWPSKRETVYEPAKGTLKVTIVAPGDIRMVPSELYFYVSDDETDLDRTTVLSNETGTGKNVFGASIEPDPDSSFGADGDQFYTLVQPPAGSHYVPRRGTLEFVVRFRHSLEQKNARLVIQTELGERVVSLNGKTFLKP